jgi:hypothetical protein
VRQSYLAHKKSDYRTLAFCIGIILNDRKLIAARQCDELLAFLQTYADGHRIIPVRDAAEQCETNAAAQEVFEGGYFDTCPEICGDEFELCKSLEHDFINGTPAGGRRAKLGSGTKIIIDTARWSTQAECVKQRRVA